MVAFVTYAQMPVAAALTAKRGTRFIFMGSVWGASIALLLGTALIKLLGGVEMPTSGRVRRRMSVSWPLGFAGGGALSRARLRMVAQSIQGRAYSWRRKRSMTKLWPSSERNVSNRTAGRGIT